MAALPQEIPAYFYQAQLVRSPTAYQLMLPLLYSTGTEVWGLASPLCDNKPLWQHSLHKYVISPGAYHVAFTLTLLPCVNRSIAQPHCIVEISHK